ncbi:hypothetical protein BpHYR1_045680 [Brachionus plicatilis]|uniref:Uncharacterized protein n=1 Tax=Brachionus plicatilis TaxID=10195 RepID=A0A3M7QHB5_BRAPC|nr:hypothetical protein BpHYR1_045680 [Brachionus plicatilis]
MNLNKEKNNPKLLSLELQHSFNSFTIGLNIDRSYADKSFTFEIIFVLVLCSRNSQCLDYFCTFV